MHYVDIFILVLMFLIGIVKQCWHFGRIGIFLLIAGVPGMVKLFWISSILLILCLHGNNFF